MNVLSSCQTVHDATGATITATAFLVVFACLLVGDGVLTALALRSALAPVRMVVK